eukprot:Phypoly_transcript_15259.p1 GENE.Phypoly_transcript_15259~~Phypoly_transcript_15259.p1  ORF type:complete len:240 (+),score=33.11 Phypoly_transcript_15259:208-927(+)
MGKTIVVGDVHGCIDELRDLLVKCEYNEFLDNLVFVGDLVGKGPSGHKVVEFARTHKAKCVVGNHDDLLIAIKKGQRPKEHMKDPTHIADYENMSDADWDYFTNLSHYVELPIKTESGAPVVVVHAGLQPGVPLDAQQPFNMMNMRNLDESGTPLKEAEKGTAWIDKWEGPYFVIFGHDAIRGIQKTDWALGLDTGCCYGNRLSAVILPKFEVVSVEARKMYSVPTKPISKVIPETVNI